MRTTLYHLHLDIDATSHEVARVWLHEDGNRESATLSYSESWLVHPQAYAIDPALPLQPGVFHTRPGQRLFGCLADAAPDRWGRRLLAEHAGRASIGEAEVLSQGQDVLRMGALRVMDPARGEFVAAGTAVPTLDHLSALSRAAMEVSEPKRAPSAVEMLWQPGAAMGGANPKAMVQDGRGQLWMAKFSSSSDIIDIVRWEALCLTLALKAGIEVPRFELKPIPAGAALLAQRFDRTDQGRVGYVSGHTLVGAADGVDYTYMDLRDAIVAHGADPETDIRELWKRMVFNLAICNQDDHLRNHGFLRRADGWHLAPAFDLTPTPPRYQKPRHALSIGGQGNGRFEHALTVAGEFELTTQEAVDAIDDIRMAMACWRDDALALGIPSRQISHLAPSLGVRSPA